MSKSIIFIATALIACCLLACSEGTNMGFTQGLWRFDGQLTDSSCANATSDNPNIQINFALDEVGEAVRGYGDNEFYSGQKTANNGLDVSSSFRTVDDCVGEQVITLNVSNIDELYSDQATLRITQNCDSGGGCFLEFQGFFSGEKKDNDYFD